MDGMQQKFHRRLDVLEDVFSFISEFVKREHLDDSIRFVLDLVIEELFVNTVRYQPGNPNALSLRLSKEEDRLTVTLVDYDVEPFDLTKKDAYDIARPLEERRPGGAGIHLVKQYMDDVAYEYKDGNSRITLIKTLEKSDV